MPPPPPGFTGRQLEVVVLLAVGCSTAEIGARLGISSRTARAHCDVLRAKLDVARSRQIPGAFVRRTGYDVLAAAAALERPAPPERSA